MRFGRLLAVSDVNLTLNHAEDPCIIGPDGAGKSTLFNIASGI